MFDLLPDSVREQLILQITPTKDELVIQKRVISQLVSALSKQAETLEYDYSFIEAQGSTGKKQTQLRGAADIDLFIGFRPEDYPEILNRDPSEVHHSLDSFMNELIERWFEPAVAKLSIEKMQKAFSQHPFLSLKIEGIDVDILGCFDIDAETLARTGPITAVDRTVHHSRYVEKHLDEKKRQNIRILKSFVRACHAYGDTCAVGRMGLTGVALELLVIDSPDLNSAIRSLESLDQRPYDPLQRSLEDLRKVPSFRDDHLFIIDPTDPSRNIASSFTLRAYRWVQYRIRRLRELLKENNEEAILDIFLEAPIPEDDLPDWLIPNAFSFEFEATGEVHYTILRDKLYRLARKIATEMESERTGEPRFGEILTEVLFRENNYALGFLCERVRLPAIFIRRGPPIHLTDATREFRMTHEDVIEEDGYLYLREKREWISAQDMVDSLLNQYTIDGLKLVTKQSTLTRQVLNVLYRFILPIETQFAERMTRVKHTEE